MTEHADFRQVNKILLYYSSCNWSFKEIKLISVWMLYAWCRINLTVSYRDLSRKKLKQVKSCFKTWNLSRIDFSYSRFLLEIFFFLNVFPWCYNWLLLALINFNLFTISWIELVFEKWNLSEFKKERVEPWFYSF